MEKLPKYASFISLAALILLMTAATVIERYHGSESAFRLVYHNPLFFALWAVVAVCGLIWLIRRGTEKKIFTLGLHLAYIVILAGALVTHIFSSAGQMHLREGESSSSFTLENGGVGDIPFSIRLEEFRIEHYTGSMAPSDYRSRVTILPEGKEFDISMNRILKYGGYRFYQEDFDEDRQGSTLGVSHDPWGNALTYTGYLMLLISMLGFFFQKGTAFRAALKRISRASVIVLGLFICSSLKAGNSATDMPKALPEEVAEAIGDLYVYYNDRICPLSTQCRDYCLKAYGKASWNGYTAEQVVTGWLFYPDWWKVVPFKLKKGEAGGPKEEEKKFLQRSVASGDALKIFPVAGGDGSPSWYSCNDPLPQEVLDNYEHWTFIRKVLDLMEESVRREDWNGVTDLTAKIKSYQQKTAAEVLPSPARVKAEYLYNSISRPMVPFMACISFGLLLFIICGVRMARGKTLAASLRNAAAVMLALLWIYLTAALGLRWYVSGHAPFAGTYCVMMLMAWLSSLTAVLFFRKFELLLPMGLMIAGFTMLMASLSSANPQITRMMPVLQSPLLSIHVLAMMMSYTLFGLVALCGIMGLLLPGGAPCERLKDYSLVILYPGVFLLAFGTFLGAVWANISWGSYWAWDPKETWALITLLVYSFALHQGSISLLRKPRVFHAYCIAAFLAVLVTYFGVNLFLGGVHAYN